MATPRPYQDDTIGDMADRAKDGWLWAHCPLPCGRAVAVPMEFFVARYGRAAPAETIFAVLRCSSCGGHPTTFNLPSYAGSPSNPGRLAPIPWERVPGPIRESLGVFISAASNEGGKSDMADRDSGKPADGRSGSTS